MWLSNVRAITKLEISIAIFHPAMNHNNYYKIRRNNDVADDTK